MFLLGHSCWSYLISKSTGRGLKVSLPLYLALLSGVLPDFDIYFRPFIEHHTITHSLLFLGPITILLTYRYKRLGVAFSMGILSHLLTDSLVGTIPILYPVSSFTVGLNLGIPSVADTLLETGALAVTIALVFENADYVLFTRRGKDRLPIAIPMLAIVTLTLLFAGDYNIPLAAVAFSRRALTVITVGHFVLVAALSVGTVQGIRGYLEKPKNLPSETPLRSLQHMGTITLLGQWQQTVKLKIRLVRVWSNGA